MTPGRPEIAAAARDLATTPELRDAAENRLVQGLITTLVAAGG